MKTNKPISPKTEKTNALTALLHSLGNYVSRNYLILVVFLLAFTAVVLIAFFAVASSGTVFSYAVSDFEAGQIADRTIIADKTLAPDAANPASIEKGEKVVRKGFPITEEALAKLQKMAEAPSYIDYRVFADKVLYLMLLSALWFLLFTPALTGVKASVKECVLLAIFFVSIYALAVFGRKLAPFSSAYNVPIVIPGVLFIILTAVLFGQLHAVFFSFIAALGVLNADAANLIPALFVLASCLASARIVRKIEKRIDLVFASLLIALLNLVFMVTFKIIFLDSFSNALFTLLMIALNGFISGILALGFLTPLESLLNTASVFRLMDLSDLNNPVMRKMLLTASGTYNHSMMVATLAESACREIGANSLLARVGAYYHDLGKVDQSEYFVENQTGGNKHDEINPRLSASVIKSHVKRGIEKAHQLRLPPEVIDIIAEHHGNGLISYFYNEAKKQDDTVTPEEFSYIGNPPSSRESAVVMLADTVEAACRTLEKPSVSRLEKFIHQLVMGKFEHHQLDKSELTFKDLAVIEDSFVQILAGYYHSRIEYPNQKDPDDDTPAKERGDDEKRSK